jgi:hypothetical protein
MIELIKTREEMEQAVWVAEQLPLETAEQQSNDLLEQFAHTIIMRAFAKRGDSTVSYIVPRAMELVAGGQPIFVNPIVLRRDDYVARGMALCIPCPTE